jgi:hypothetical protein
LREISKRNWAIAGAIFVPRGGLLAAVGIELVKRFLL